MRFQALVYVAALPRAVRPSGDWSTRTARASARRPSIASWGPGAVHGAVAERAREAPVEDLLGEGRLARAARAGDSADDAERDVGRRSRRGCSRCAPRTTRQRAGAPAALGRPRRASPTAHARPVGRSVRSRELAGRPVERRSSPPCVPAPGPSSITRSHARTTAASCSMTTHSVARARELAHRARRAPGRRSRAAPRSARRGRRASP